MLTRSAHLVRRLCHPLTTASVAALLLISTACSVSTLTTILTTITAAAEVAVPIITGSSNPALTQEIMAYLHAVSVAVTETTVELQSTDTSVVRAEKISVIWAGVVLNPTVLQSLPPNIRTVVQAVASAVENLLAHITTARRAATSSTTNLPDFIPNHKDRVELNKLAQRANAVAIATTIHK